MSLEFDSLVPVQNPVTTETNRIVVTKPKTTAALPSKPVEFRMKRFNIPSQPRPRAEEMKLAAKYASIESLEERAFQILVDLGMVEIHN